MTVSAFIEEAPRQQRSERRWKLKLLLRGAKASGSSIAALVHNISATGILIECDAAMEPGEELEIALPHAGAVIASVIWASERLYGCRFDAPISQATLSAAQLRSVTMPHAKTEPDQQSPSSETFGLRLQRLRAAKGLTQLHVATHLGVSEPSVSAWELDKSRPKAGRIEALAGLLGVPSSELLGIGSDKTLHEVISHAKDEIAAIVNVPPDQIRITVEF